MNLTFSVITPSYCQGRFIERTIQSVLAQKESDIKLEYLICDGGSNDETLDILKSYSDRLDWISEPDKGQADAVNKGISLTKGEIIAWINSDDIYYPGTFAAVQEIFASNPEIEAIYGDADHIDIDDKIIEPYPTESWNYKHLFEICYFCQPAVFFRRNLVEKFGNLDDSLKYCMDYELWLRYGKHIQFYYLPRKLAGSRLYQENKTLGQRITVHYEINEMFQRKFGKVPEKWIFAYAHIKTEETMHLNRACRQENKKFVNAVVKTTFWSSWHWKKCISLKGYLRMIFWLLRANFLGLDNLQNFIRSRI